MEKFFDIVCRVGSLTPSAVVLVATVKALKHHGGNPDGGPEAIAAGSANLIRHLGTIRAFGLNAVVAVNRFPADSDEEIEQIREIALSNGAFAAEANEAVARGGEGAARLAEAVVAATEQPSSFAPVYPLEDTIERKIEAIATRVYGADGILLQPAARKKIEELERVGFDKLPICMAKTHLSLSHDPTLANAPTGFTVTVRDIRAYTGAGWLVALCGDMQTMPGYGRTPAAHNVDIDDEGRTVGLF
jgi:formyltetrahydrofolate synthetase